MKHIILILSALICLKVKASEFIQSSFWYATQPEQLKLKIESLQESLAEECEEHYKTLHQFTDFNREDVAFYNSLPLKKQMGSQFVAIFRVKSLTGTESRLANKLQTPLLKLDVDHYELNLQKATVRVLSFTPQSLSALSIKAGAVLAAPTFQINSLISDEVFLITDRRDMACDLINKRVQIAVRSTVKYLLSENSEKKLTAYTEQLSTGINSILNKNESVYVKAAKIGLMASQLQSTPEAANQLIEHIFNTLFTKDSLNLSSIWQMKPDHSLYLSTDVSAVQSTDNILIEL